MTGIGLSAHRDAQPVVRMQPDIQNQGYAAGVAAAMAAGRLGCGTSTSAPATTPGGDRQSARERPYRRGLAPSRTSGGRGGEGGGRRLARAWPSCWASPADFLPLLASTTGQPRADQGRLCQGPGDAWRRHRPGDTLAEIDQAEDGTRHPTGDPKQRSPVRHSRSDHQPPGQHPDGDRADGSHGGRAGGAENVGQTRSAQLVQPSSRGTTGAWNGSATPGAAKPLAELLRQPGWEDTRSRPIKDVDSEKMDRTRPPAS